MCCRQAACHHHPDEFIIVDKPVPIKIGFPDHLIHLPMAVALLGRTVPHIDMCTRLLATVLRVIEFLAQVPGDRAASRGALKLNKTA